MDELLKKLLTASGISGYENEIAGLMKSELSKYCQDTQIDGFGNVIAKKGQSRKKIMVAAYMDKVGLV